MLFGFICIVCCVWDDAQSNFLVNLVISNKCVDRWHLLWKIIFRQMRMFEGTIRTKTSGENYSQKCRRTLLNEAQRRTWKWATSFPRKIAIYWRSVLKLVRRSPSHSSDQSTHYTHTDQILKNVWRDALSQMIFQYLIGHVLFLLQLLCLLVQICNS